MSSKELRKKFSDKKDKSSYYLNVINEYFDCVDEIYKKGKGGYTKKYKLKEWIKDLTKTYLKNNDPIIISDISDNEKKIIDLNGIGMNGVVGLENEDFNKSDIFIPSTIKINIEKLDEWIEFLEFTDNDIQKVSKDRILFQLMCVRKYINNNQSPNKLIQFYIQRRCGRFFSKSNKFGLHPISLKDDVRHIIWSDMDKYYFDISNCHLSIFNELGEKYGVKSENIKYYLDNKSDIRKSWSKKYGSSKVKHIKSYVISWLFGGTKNLGEFNSFNKVLSWTIQKHIKDENHLLMGIWDEIVRVRNVICDNVEMDNGNYLNVWGNKLSVLNEKGKKRHKKNILSHILYGYESKTMEVVNTKIDSEMDVLIYDGYIGKDMNTEILSEVVKKELDLNIKFDKELISSPNRKYGFKSDFSMGMGLV